MHTRFETSTTAESTVVPEPRSTDGSGEQLRLELAYTGPNVAVLNVAGEVDLASAPRLCEFLRCRLHSALTEFELDLSQLGFMSVAGVRVLEQAATLARCGETRLKITIGGSRAARRVLLATGSAPTLPLTDW